MSDMVTAVECPSWELDILMAEETLTPLRVGPLRVLMVKVRGLVTFVAVGDIELVIGGKFIIESAHGHLPHDRQGKTVGEAIFNGSGVVVIPLVELDRYQRLRFAFIEA